jgi:hypothetical protein
MAVKTLSISHRTGFEKSCIAKNISPVGIESATTLTAYLSANDERIASSPTHHSNRRNARKYSCSFAVEFNSLRGWRAWLASHSLLHRLCRNSGVNRPRLQITRGYRTQAKHRTVAQVHSRGDRSTGTHPRVGAQFHRKGNKWERWVVVVVRGPANVSLLRNDSVRSHGYRRRVIDLRLVAQRNPVSAQEIPGCPYARPWIEMAVGAKPGSEATQEKSAPGMKGTGRGPKQESPAYGPRQPAHAVREGERRPEVRVGGLGCWIHRRFAIRAESFGNRIPPLRYPDFLSSLVALADCMQLSVRKAAHAGVAECSVTEIRVRSGPTASRGSG